VPSLPVTGSTPLWFALAGLAALGSGALLVLLIRRRRTTFTS
jgi:LPXTG-motif cell wall-anchored protein